MVFTGAVGTARNAGTRRQVLLAATTGLGLAAAGGCDLFTDDPDRPPPPDPLIPLRDEALAIAAAYDRTTGTQPGLAGRLAPIAAAHRAHAAELSRVIGSAAPTGSAAPAAPSAASSPAAALTALRSAEVRGQRAAARACLAAPAGRAALVGSIAAARAAHAEALR